MSTRKERRKFIHEPSLHEIFYCLSEMPDYSKILLNENPDRGYADFLHWLLDKRFYKERTDKISIKMLAANFKTNSSKVTKWLKEIYHDIFELNYDKPKLFQNDGINVSIYMKHYDSTCEFSLSLPAIPREFETVKFSFAKGKVGTDIYWVKKVEHEILDNASTITLWLEGGIMNKYREFALDKALFQGRIHFMDVYEKHDFELDKELKTIYKD